MQDPRADQSLPLTAARRIDEACQQFEEALRSGTPRVIEDCLAEFAGEDLARSALLRELLALELEYRLRCGEQPAAAEYSARFPEPAGLVELVFREAGTLAPFAVPPFLVGHPRYRVVRLLGCGGMGAVYLAEHRVLGRLVALKVIRPELLAEAAGVERFRREAQAAASLNHPNIVTVYDAETAGESHFLVMEYVPGSDLARAVAEQGPLPVQRACDYVRQAALGLRHAHEHGMVHRDITPRNLMLTDAGQVKVLDFGLAHVVSETMAADGMTSPGTLLGSADYMAPEQAADPHAADIRADIYSLGCMLYFLLAGRPPFPSGSLYQKLKAHAEQPPPAIGDIRSDVPPALVIVLARMLAKDPAARYQTPQEVADALAAFVSPPLPPGEAITRPPLPRGEGRGEGEHRETLPPWRPSIAGFSSRRRAPVVIAAASLLLGALLLIAWRGLRSPHTGRLPEGEGDSPPATAREQTEAYRLYREGLHLLGQRQETQMRAAIKRLVKSTQLDPRFAPAWTALADTYNLCGDYGWDAPDEVFPKAKEAARAALALDDQRADAHLALAFALHAYDANWERAEAEYRRALELDPNLPAAHHWYAWFLVQQRRLDEAEQHIERAQQLAPDQLIIANNVGKIHYLCRAYAVAVEKHKYALELDPGFRKAHYDLGLTYAEMGKLDEALREFDLAKGLTEDDRDITSARAYAYARNGRPAEARRVLPQLELASTQKPLAYEIATIYAALGEKDLAFHRLDLAFRRRSAARTSIKVDPRLDGLRTDERFKPLLKKAGLGS